MTSFSLYRLLEECIHKLGRQSEGPPAGYIRLEKEVACPVDLLSWINSVQIPEKFYFSERDREYSLGGLGTALVIRETDPSAVMARLDRLWEMNGQIRLFGGIRFNLWQNDAPEWEGFTPFRFSLPFVELEQTGSTLRIRVNCLNRKGLSSAKVALEISERLQVLDALTEEPPPLGARAAIEKQILLPSKKRWNQMVKSALRSIHQDTLRKIVLARKRIILSQNPWDVRQLLSALARIDEGSFLFYYQVDFGKAFIGRSPERLLRVRKHQLLADAIAGTRTRGKNPRDDERLEAQLLHCAKELDEHRIVAGFIQEKMARFCSPVNTECLETVLKLKNIQHILTRYTGRLNKEINPLETVLSFHPTPAVGGCPPDHIAGHIARCEPFERGWYAAPIGWLSKNAADFAVGIRSALVNGRELHLFAGAGIVKGSNPHAEWNETEKKMDNFTFILGGG